ncbi:MAG: hypothetical protein EZS28_012730 [Streblomastix strix]|uniref:SPRY domain-containing protein n=1 Tax=Streblomastix strix TaxID=222440 RepID=A0A5J4WAR5_9EUKA|nr:MAG: hypothetical protein EZS28_012730 [Streblomastix strix]
MGLLNVILKLVEVEAEFIQINPFISIVQQLRICAQSEELKQKLDQILDLFSHQHHTGKSNRPKTQNEQIAELEAKKVWLQQQLTVEREEQQRVSVELIRICEQKEIHQREKERERSIRLSTQGEIRRIKEDQKRQKELANRQQLQLQLPVEQEYTTVRFGIVPRQGPFLYDPKTMTFTNNTLPSSKLLFAIDTKIDKDIYRCTFRINTCSLISVGIFEGGSNIDQYNEPNHLKFVFDKLLFNSKGEVWQHHDCSTEKNGPMKKGDIVSLEVDMNLPKTIHLFINKIEQPIFMSKIPNSVQFIFGLRDKGDSISMLSLKKTNIQSHKAISGRKKYEWDDSFDDRQYYYNNGYQ